MDNVFNDYLNKKTDKKFNSYLSEGEEIIFSCELHKTNHRKKVQLRKFVITNKFIYNLGYSENIFKTILGIYIKRKIDIKDIKGFIYSKYSNNFILKIVKKHDYYLNSIYYEEIWLSILYSIKINKYDNIKFLQVKKINLFDLVKTKKMSKDVINNYDDFKDVNYDILLEVFKTNKINLNQFFKNKIFKTNEEVNETDFEIIKLLGKGGFGFIYLIRMKETLKLYVIKVITKVSIIFNNSYELVKIEKSILKTNDNPFILNLKFFLNTQDYIMFGLKYLSGGDLYNLLKAKTFFKEYEILFYSAQILLCLEYLHSKNIIYRDLKPENILIHKSGYICLTDFGISKILGIGNRAKTYVGTIDYLSPEIISRVEYDYSVDIWAFGIFLYELKFGYSPFLNGRESVFKNNIVNEEIKFEKEISNELKDLISWCLEKDPNLRNNGESISSLKKHAFFKTLNWNLLKRRKIQAPNIPPDVKIDHNKKCEDLSKTDDLFKKYKNLLDVNQNKFKDI